MTNQSHTELAALVKASKALLERYRVMGCGDGIEARNVELALAALESPERVLGEAWPADLSGHQRTQSERFAVIKRDNGEPVIDDDDFKFDALIVVHGDFDDGEKEKYVAEVCRRLNAASPSPQAEKQPLSEAEIKDVVWGYVEDINDINPSIVCIIRAVEAAHGIVTKEST